VVVVGYLSTHHPEVLLLLVLRRKVGTVTQRFMKEPVEVLAQAHRKHLGP
jgi:hypothetical protein